MRTKKPWGQCAAPPGVPLKLTDNQEYFRHGQSQGTSPEIAPGDLAEKVNPYLRPLYGALHDMVDFARARKLVERGTITAT